MKSLLLAASFVVVTAAHAASPKVGMAISVDGDGFFLNPIVRKVTISEVEKGSLAELAGISVGDEILEVEGQSIAGRRGNDLRALTRFNPGEPRQLRLRRANGEEYTTQITKPVD
ncbi:hypothetical protein BH10PSE17_BH10PSE17_10760 [soil metagenome]